MASSASNPAREEVESVFQNAWGNRIHFVIRWTTKITGPRERRGPVFEVKLGSETFHLALVPLNEHYKGVRGPGLVLFPCCMASPRSAALRGSSVTQGHRMDCPRSRPREILSLQDERAQTFLETILDLDPLASSMVAQEILDRLETFLKEEWAPTRFDPGTRKRVIYLGGAQDEPTAATKGKAVKQGRAW